jgi:hypothetical protein
MADKNLPIKFFEKRKKDELSNEGRGGGKPPKFVLHAKELRSQSSYVNQFLGNVGNTLRTKVKKDNFMPSVFKVKIKEKAIAKTHRGEIGRLFNTRDKVNIIGVLGDDELLIKVDNIEDLDIIEKNVQNTERNAIGLSAISELDNYEPIMHFENGKGVLKVKLFNYQDYELNKVLLRAFENYCKENEIKFEKLEYTPDLNLYRIVLDGGFEVEEIKSFDGVYSIADMPVVETSLLNKEGGREIEIKQPEKEKDYPIVGVLDSGIADNPYLKPWIMGSSERFYMEDDIDKAHGTFVAGVILYGDELEGIDYTGVEGCKLFEAVVFPKKTNEIVYENVLIAQIQEVIKKNNHIKIWNLSLGSSNEAGLNEFSDFGKALDKLQDDYNVLIVKSAGNCDRFQHGGPKSRIARSADSVRSLVVGSLAPSKIETDMAEKNYPSPFTRIGPGPGKLIKPDLVHMGGNAGMIGRKMFTNGVSSFDVDGKIASNIGTSFSTPRVTALAAGLMSKLNEDFNPLLLKALLIHAAKYPVDLSMTISEKIKQVGFGLPSKIDDIIYNDEHEITLILQDTLERGSYFHILDFPYPQSMVDDGFYYGEITVTLVNSPILADNQGAEYCQSDVKVSLGTYDEKKERDTTKRGIKNPFGPDGGKNILHHSCYSKTIMNQIENPFNSERILINYGDNFQPNKKFAVKLEEFTESNRQKYLKAPKLWFLKVENSFRDNIEVLSKQEGTEPINEFCLIVTIRDTRKKQRVYDEVNKLLNEYQFLHSSIKLKEEIRIINKN